MLRPGWRKLVLVGALLFGAGCMTYQQDLGRAREHYRESRFENALALLRILEHDVDSLSEPERVQYAYLRGMTDYRLSSESGGAAMDEPRERFRDHAKYWLSVAMAMEIAAPGSITQDEKERLAEAMVSLGGEVNSKFGATGQGASADSGAAADPGATVQPAPAAPAEPAPTDAAPAPEPASVPEAPAEDAATTP